VPPTEGWPEQRGGEIRGKGKERREGAGEDSEG
jgi:hypothetical protein